MSRASWIGGLAVSIAATALVVASLSSLSDSPPGLEARLADADASHRAIREYIAGLAESLGRLERSVQNVETLLQETALASRAMERGGKAADASSTEDSEDGASEERRQIEEITRRFEELAARFEEAASARVVATPTGVNVETAAEREQIVAKVLPVALDRSRMPQERLRALRELRFRDGRTYEVMLAMIELIEDPQTAPDVRADIIRNLDGVEFAELKAPLLRVLSEDPDPETRAETVETLEAFYGDPEVERAVVRVRDGDADPRVRLEAAERLARWGK